MTRHDRPRPAAARAARERVVDWLDGSAGNAEHVLDAGLLETGDDEFPYLHLDQVAARCRRGDVVFGSARDG
jgi:hypothetical protein